MPGDRALIPEVDPLLEKSAFDRLVERIAQRRPVTWFLVHVGRHVDPVLMRISGGRVNLTGIRAIVVLHHLGAKTGKLRQTPLAYFTVGKDVVLVASSGGMPRHPAWLHNIRANPDVELWVGQRGGMYRARVATPQERVALWSKAKAFYAGYDGYQRRAGDREIPVIICSPRG